MLRMVHFQHEKCPFSSQSGVEKGVSPYFLGKIAQNNPLFCVNFQHEKCPFSSQSGVEKAVSITCCVKKCLLYGV